MIRAFCYLRCSILLVTFAETNCKCRPQLVKGCETNTAPVYCLCGVLNKQTTKDHETFLAVMPTHGTRYYFVAFFDDFMPSLMLYS